MFLCDLPSSQKHHKEQAGRSSSDYIPQTESWITLRAGRWPQQRGGVTVQHHRLTLQRDSGSTDAKRRVNKSLILRCVVTAPPPPPPQWSVTVTF
ncbi:hypothetical protein INR49_020799 [Caranx melampygus]|nr:hypothetical protein INR49_020799 [Caranx melampygus]